jgi:predicted transcriptional regulator
VALTLRADDEPERALDALCARKGRSRQEVIRRAVQERLEHAGHSDRIDTTTTRMIDRWGDVPEHSGRA